MNRIVRHTLPFTECKFLWRLKDGRLLIRVHDYLFENIQTAQKVKVFSNQLQIGSTKTPSGSQNPTISSTQHELLRRIQVKIQSRSLEWNTESGFAQADFRSRYYLNFKSNLIFARNIMHVWG